MLKHRINLIPRYNWDYGFSDFIKASPAAFKQRPDKEDGLQKIFGHEPIYTGSGRASLYVILKALDLPEGSHVGVPLFCCPVVFGAVKKAGLIPKFIDIDLNDYNLSAVDFDKKKEQLSAVVVVHMFGHPADMGSISSISDHIPVIEDCAQSLFSKYQGDYTGFLSNASFFSFRSGKYVSAGEGSAIFSKNGSISQKIKTITQGLDRQSILQEMIHCTATLVKSTLYHRPWYGTIGLPVGTRIDRKLNLTAKTGFSLAKIAKTDLSIINSRIQTFGQKVQKQKQNSVYFLENLKIKDVVLPREKNGSWSNYYQFAIRFPDTIQRDQMAAYLFERGIDTAKYLDEVIDVAAENYGYQGDCPNAELCSKTVLVIPNHYTLSKKDLDYIIDCLNNGAKEIENS